MYFKWWPFIACLTNVNVKVFMNHISGISVFNSEETERVDRVHVVCRVFPVQEHSVMVNGCKWAGGALSDMNHDLRVLSGFMLWRLLELWQQYGQH